MPSPDPLTADEIVPVVRIATGPGITEVRLTVLAVLLLRLTCSGTRGVGRGVRDPAGYGFGSVGEAIHAVVVDEGNFAGVHTCAT